MISLDLDITLFYNVGIDLFSIAVLLFLYDSCRRGFADTHDTRLLCQTELAVILTMFSDIGTWVMNGVPGSAARTFLFLDNILYLLLQLFVVRDWLHYVHYRIYQRDIPRKAVHRYIIGPFLIIVAFIVTTPFTGLCFYLDSGNYYHRGILSAPFSVVVMAFLLYSTGLAWYKAKSEVLYDRKREFISIAFFPALPMLGGLLQMLIYGCSILWPCVTLATLLVCLRKEDQAVSLDSLTRLNNRGSFDRYLHICTTSDPRPITLVMMDLNHFKEINDRYGHIIGDSALLAAADLLRALFNKKDAFISRFGGDEFTVIIPGNAPAAAEALTASIRQAFLAWDPKKEYPFRLSVSIGCAFFDGVTTETAVSDLLRTADTAMYQDKQKYRTEQI